MSDILATEEQKRILTGAIEQAGERTPGKNVKVRFSGVFYCNEGEEPPPGYNRHREFSVVFRKNAERFLKDPSFDLLFTQYGLESDGVYLLKVNGIIVEYVD